MADLNLNGSRCDYNSGFQSPTVSMPPFCGRWHLDRRLTETGHLDDTFSTTERFERTFSGRTDPTPPANGFYPRTVRYCATCRAHTPHELRVT